MIKFQKNSGAALAIVLGLLVITFCVAVIFLAQVGSERSVAAGYSATVSTRLLADTAVNLVQGQIRDATTQGMTATWASQPGMIRTYNQSGRTTQKAYKLYSSDQMVLEQPSAIDLQADFPASDWSEEKALWTDLNAPVTADGRLVYPILSGEALGEVEGFSITNSTVVETANPVPMPVRWLYVLQDGRVVFPTGSGNDLEVAGSSEANPVVGRIAFWTDDETSKININTASEGTFWDIPRLNATGERGLAEYQPAQREFQRYPGHPAMTSLAPVLMATQGVAPAVLTKAQRDAIYEVTPRVVSGGSDGGSVVYTSNSALALDNDRLYTSLDELIFNPLRGDQPTALAIDRDTLERGRFFMTAVSRAPEVTLFNTPRIAAWPIDANTGNSYRSPFDRLIAFCSTIGGQPYHFTRSDPQSETADFTGSSRNQALYRYLQELTSREIPGFGGSLLAKYPSVSGRPSDRDQILTSIFDYLRTTNLNDPMITDNFYQRGVRGGNNIGLGQVTPIQIGNTRGFGRFPLISEIGIQFICTADGGDGTAGGIANSNIHGNRTLERITPTTAVLLNSGERRIEAMLLLELFTPGMGWPRFHPTVTFRIKGLESLVVSNTVGGVLFPNSRFPTTGVSAASSAMSPGALNAGLANGGTVSPRFLTAHGRSPARLGGQIPADGESDVANPYSDPLPLYPFISDPITVMGTTMEFSSGPITIEVYAGQHADVTGLTPIYTQQVQFPATTVPVPQLVEAAYGGIAPEGWWSFSGVGAVGGAKGRLNRAASNPGQPATPGAGAPFHPRDVVRTLSPSVADYRMLLGDQVSFEVIGSGNVAHTFNEGGRSGFFFGYRSATLTNGLAPNTTYSIWGNPDVPKSSPLSAHGDWDNGLASWVDGAYINKADEGNAGAGAGKIPYFDDEHIYSTTDVGRFSPNRQMPSAGMFGSLPTGIHSGNPFQTLLFRRQAGHPQSPQSRPGMPADHLITDLFWMPVVEPYAVSEPFSTAGKINMNYAIMPFSYLRRATALHGAMRAERLLAVPPGDGPNYKIPWGTPVNRNRVPIDIGQTLFQMDARFQAHELFRSPSEICDIHLIPSGQTWITSASYAESALDQSAATFWTQHRLTGDNTREQPYTNLLGRLTTKSNTFTVHYRVQALKQSVTSARDGKWDESRDTVIGEYRGSTTLERYISPNDMTIPDYASATTPASLSALPTLGQFYKWRTVATRQFTP